METLNIWFKEYEVILTVGSTVFIGIVALLITWVYAARSKAISEDEIFYNLYSKFNERYDKINDILQELYIVNIGKEMTTEELKNDIRFHSACMDFFNICAEEHYWNGKKRIEKEVWNAWCYGMNDWYGKIEVLRLLWKEEIHGEKYKSYYLKKGDNLFIE